MKLCRFEYHNVTSYGMAEQEFIRPLESDPFENDLTPSEERIQISTVSLLTPVAPSKIVCVGRNYAAHAAELGNAVPEAPLLFLKAPSALQRDGEPIITPSCSEQVEHEGELGVVIRRRCSGLSENDDPLSFVLGYLCLNDVTARDIQKKEVQFTRAKSFDTFCPVGRFIETDLDPSDIRVTTTVNGEIRQDGRTSQMVFPVAFLIRYISNQMTLMPGDVIATGTPAGVSKIQSGDVCEVTIEGVGTLSNPIVNCI